ncbi:hypothetical protein BB560_005603 [Smittium megazygosporum]|uniref:Uncharacterized protein n=1 Tax=Smittium megazygosporum TaxID=133381 RepID=A0A2T9Z2Q7_9FUNG|nr:hypothetical protein BB560_005603 [Smittium megazygosporum]
MVTFPGGFISLSGSSTIEVLRIPICILHVLKRPFLDSQQMELDDRDLGDSK